MLCACMSTSHSTVMSTSCTVHLNHVTALQSVLLFHLSFVTLPLDNVPGPSWWTPSPPVARRHSRQWREKGSRPAKQNRGTQSVCCKLSHLPLSLLVTIHYITPSSPPLCAVSYHSGLVHSTPAWSVSSPVLLQTVSCLSIHSYQPVNLCVLSSSLSSDRPSPP